MSVIVQDYSPVGFTRTRRRIGAAVEVKIAGTAGERMESEALAARVAALEILLEQFVVDRLCEDDDPARAARRARSELVRSERVKAAAEAMPGVATDVAAFMDRVVARLRDR